MNDLDTFHGNANNIVLPFHFQHSASDKIVGTIRNHPYLKKGESLARLHRLWRRRVIGISGSLIWSKTLMEPILIPVVNFGEVRRAQLAKSTLLTSTLVPLGSFQVS